MNNLDNQPFKALLVTKGRKTGKEHSVWLRAVMYKKKIYFSRRNSNSDWLKNSLINPQVRIEFDNSTYSGTASLVREQWLTGKISSIKYSDVEKAKESRIVLQVTIDKK